MAESFVHKLLVEQGLSYSKNVYMKERQYISYCSILDNSINNFSPQLSLPSGERFYADFYLKTMDNTIEIIGEAKISKDIENSHTINQLSAYIQYANQTRTKVYLIIVVPFGNLGKVKSLLRNYIPQYDVNNVFVDIKEF